MGKKWFFPRLAMWKLAHLCWILISNSISLNKSKDYMTSREIGNAIWHPPTCTDVFALFLSMPIKKMDNIQLLITKELAILREGGSIITFLGLNISSCSDCHLNSCLAKGFLWKVNASYNIYPGWRALHIIFWALFLQCYRMVSSL